MDGLNHTAGLVTRSPVVRSIVRGLVSSLWALLIANLVLEFLAWRSPRINYLLSPPWSRVQVKDPEMGYRMSPFYPDVDFRGYRNVGRVESCDLLAVGDSMTYGFGVPREAAWPQQLARQSGVSVYNGGVGGYGPCEYRAVVAELLRLHPRVVVLALFVGNDIGDAYKSVYANHRCPDQRSTDSRTLAAMARADEQATLRRLAERYGDAVPSSPSVATWKNFALYRLVRVMNAQAAGGALDPFAVGKDRSFAQAAGKPLRSVLRTRSGFRTVLVDPRRDALAVDLSDPRIGEGFRIMLAAIDGIRQQVDAAHARFLVAIIHNKPAVLSDLVRLDAPALWQQYSTLVEMEHNVTMELGAWLSAQHIRHVDTEEAMRHLVETGRMPYDDSDDNHPNADGYNVVAQSVWRVASGMTAQP